MQDYFHSLGDAVKIARSELGLTQEQVAGKIDADTRTIMNIENYKGNPKMKTLFPLIRLLKIDARDIFNPEMKRESPAIRQLRFLIEECSEQEAAALIPVIEAVLSTLRAKDASEIK
ncbi:hypothetical protein CAFE_03410 [Caprobacter fermentans]|uniref:HTH cro/C1-type domain-containing protein n=1 Tax=Caproicibacter fermentans TaxID=2576756 RepID=A0A6N8HV73_9FIRM|nr:helix-turn-helix domain-containing protein [Caproicibacter fermentans]MVB09676.1 hypothetical protein [Caproicibacter fermentans]